MVLGCVCYFFSAYSVKVEKIINIPFKYLSCSAIHYVTQIPFQINMCFL